MPSIYSLSLLTFEVLSLFSSVVTASPLLHGSSEILPRASCTNSATSRSCWGDYDLSTNYYDVVPDTGVTREYYLELQNITAAPDGVERIVLSVNGTVPGPTIEADWGDTVVVHVKNSLTTNGSTIHFHGVRQNHTNQMDGVASITQCPSAPDDTYTYTWRATNYGSSFYHSHYSLQAWDGVFGGIVIHGPASANYDVDLGTLAIQDWDHQTASALFDTAQTSGPPTLDTGLINGTNVWDGSGSYYEQVFDEGSSYLFRIVNTAIDTHFKFMIDNHTMTVVAMDFVPIVPYETDVLSIGIAQRYDVVVNASEISGDYWLRAIPQITCSNNNNVDGIVGIIRYDSTSTADPTTTGYSYTDDCDDEDISDLVPYLALNPGSEDYGLHLEDSVADSAGVFRWELNGTAMVANWEDPTVLQVYEDVTDFNSSLNVYEIDTANEWAYMIIEQTTPIPHPIHLHGHDYYVLAQGQGTYATAAPTLITTNPPRRDTVMLPGAGYIVIAWPADNPGVWLCHCHIGWHQSEGFDLQFVERYDEIPALLDTTVLNDTCASWKTFVTEENLRSTDSGV